VPTAEEKVSDKAELATMTPPVTEETPSFKNIFVKNVTCNGAGRAVFMQGLPEMNLKGIQLTHMKISSTKGIEVVDADGILFSNMSIITQEGYALQLKNSKNVTVNGLEYQVPKEGVIKLEGHLSKNIYFTKSSFKDAAKQISISNEVDKRALRIE